MPSSGFFENDIKITYCSPCKQVGKVHVNPLLKTHFAFDVAEQDFETMVQHLKAHGIESFKPSQDSRFAICRLTAPWVTHSSSAAFVKLTKRDTDSKARNAFKGGILRAILLLK